MKYINKNVKFLKLLIGVKLLFILNIFFINYRLIFYYIKIFYLKRNFIIEIDISGAKRGYRGPTTFVRGIKAFLPYKTNLCTFIPKNKLFPINKTQKSNYIYLPYPRLSESIYDKLVNISIASNIIFGPCFVPCSWNRFPNQKIWKEKR